MTRTWFVRKLGRAYMAGQKAATEGAPRVAPEPDRVPYPLDSSAWEDDDAAEKAAWLRGYDDTAAEAEKEQ